MELNSKLPNDIAGELSDHLGPDEAIRYSLASDLTLGRQFGQSYIVVTDTKVAMCDSENHARALDLADIKEVKVDELFGSCRLTAVTSDGEKNLIYYTKVHVPEFAALARVINDLAGGRPPVLPDEHELAVCPKCGAPLPERGASCPLCLPRFEVLRRLVGLVRPYRRRAIFLMALTLVGVAAQMCPPYITKLIADDVIEKKDISRLGLLIAGMALSGLVILATGYLRWSLSAWLAFRVVADLRNRLHAHLQRLRLQYITRRDSGEIVSRVMHDTGELLEFLVEGMPFLLVNSLSLVVVTVIIFSMDAKLAVLVLLPVPFLLFGGGLFWRKLIPLFHKRGSRYGALHSILNESIGGLKAVKAYSLEKQRAKQFSRSNEGLFGVSFSIERTFMGFFQVMFWIMSVGFTAVWYFAARRIATDDPTLTLGDLLAFIGYMHLLYMPMKWFATIFNWMSHALTGAERIFGVLDSPPETYDAPDAVDIPRIEGRIAFEDVRFSYERGKEVIKGVSFEIEPGEMIGLVGKSGAGKSTIINLMCRFYDVDSGLIAVDGHPIDKIKLTCLRGQIGIVMQEPFLFNASIMDNIRCCSPDVGFEEVVRAAKAANAHDFIIDKEDGYDTVVGQGGVALSGGEKQRIAIASAILHDPPILILDEATSSVDSETEKAIQEAIANLIMNRTTIAIAHRLATLRNANRLIVIDDGKIAEMGRHDELLAREGIYANLVKVQTELSQLRSTAWQE